MCLFNQMQLSMDAGLNCGIPQVGYRLLSLLSFLVALDEIFNSLSNLNPMYSLLPKHFLTKNVLYYFCDSNNLVLPRARIRLYGIDTNRFIDKKLLHTVTRDNKARVPLFETFYREHWVF